MAVVEPHDEVRDVIMRVAVECVGDREPEVVVLDVSADLVHLLKALGDGVLPTAVGDDV